MRFLANNFFLTIFKNKCLNIDMLFINKLYVFIQILINVYIQAFIQAHIHAFKIHVDIRLYFDAFIQGST